MLTDFTNITSYPYFQPLNISSPSLYVGSLLVLADMGTTVLAIILNLSVVLALKETQEMTSDNQNFLQLNMMLNNLLICVLVKSFEIVYTGLAAATQQTRSEHCPFLIIILTFSGVHFSPRRGCHRVTWAPGEQQTCTPLCHATTSV